MVTVIFEATVAYTSNPAGITAFEPGIKIHGHARHARTIARGVLFFPYTLTLVLKKTAVLHYQDSFDQ